MRSAPIKPHFIHDLRLLPTLSPLRLPFRLGHPVQLLLGLENKLHKGFCQLTRERERGNVGFSAKIRRLTTDNSLLCLPVLLASFL